MLFDSFAEPYDACDSRPSYFQLQNHEEGAALFESVARLPSGPDQEVFVVDGGAFDVEVVDVQILSAQPGPLEFFILTVVDALVDGRAQLEAGFVEIGLHVKSEGLLVLVLDCDLLVLQMVLRNPPGAEPFLSLEVERITLVVFRATDKQNLSNLITDLLGRDTRSLHSLWQWVIKRNMLNLSIIICAQDKSRLDVQIFFQREKYVSSFR